MKIIVLSDTHIPERAKDIPEELYKDMKSADLIVHAGDITSLAFFNKIGKITDLKAVHGNMDEPRLKEILPLKQMIKVNGFSIGLIHGWGSPFGMLDLVQEEFVKEKPDIIIFGHTHKTFNLRRNNILLFNPGSPTDKIFSETNSYGVITISDKIEAKIVNLV